MSMSWTYPVRCVVPDRSRPGANPGARTAAIVSTSPPDDVAGPTTTTASCAGSTESSSRPTSASDARKACGEHRRALVGRGEVAIRVGTHEVGRLHEHDRLRLPHVLEGVGDNVVVEPHAERGVRVVLEQVLAHAALGHGAVRPHQRGDRGTAEAARRLVGASSLSGAGVGSSTPSPFAITAREYPASRERVAERAHLGFEVGRLVGLHDLRQPEVHEPA